MGTNYYHHEQAACIACGRDFDSRHIGKSSVGWCFSLHIYPSEGITSLDDWLEIWETGQIKNEYDVPISSAEMEKIITDRSWDEEITEGISVHGSPGPNGLLRHTVDGMHCTGHGEGTWDYMVGTFG